MKIWSELSSSHVTAQWVKRKAEGQRWNLITVISQWIGKDLALVHCFVNIGLFFSPDLAGLYAQLCYLARCIGGGGEIQVLLRNYQQFLSQLQDASKIQALELLGSVNTQEWNGMEVFNSKGSVLLLLLRYLYLVDHASAYFI